MNEVLASKILEHSERVIKNDEKLLKLNRDLLYRCRCYRERGNYIAMSTKAFNEEKEADYAASEKDS